MKLSMKQLFHRRPDTEESSERGHQDLFHVSPLFIQVYTRLYGCWR
jgi:hypothetical protein